MGEKKEATLRSVVQLLGFDVQIDEGCWEVLCEGSFDKENRRIVVDLLLVERISAGGLVNSNDRSAVHDEVDQNERKDNPGVSTGKGCVQDAGLENI